MKKFTNGTFKTLQIKVFGPKKIPNQQIPKQATGQKKTHPSKMLKDGWAKYIPNFALK